MSPEQNELLLKREAQLRAMMAEQDSVLRDFAEGLSLFDANLILTSPRATLVPLTEYLRDQTIAPVDRFWLVARIAYLVGRLFAFELHGRWLVNTVPTSRFFLHIVVGDFAAFPGSPVSFDPFLVAASFTEAPAPRDLIAFVNEVKTDLLRFGTPEHPEPGSAA